MNDKKKKYDTRHKYTVRLTEDELNEVKDKIKKTGMSKQEYGKRCLLNKKIVVIEGVEELANQVRKVGININQIIHLANENKYVTKNQMEETIERLGEIWQLLNNFLSENKAT